MHRFITTLWALGLLTATTNAWAVSEWVPSSFTDPTHTWVKSIPDAKHTIKAAVECVHRNSQRTEHWIAEFTTNTWESWIANSVDSSIHVSNPFMARFALITPEAYIESWSLARIVDQLLSGCLKFEKENEKSVKASMPA